MPGSRRVCPFCGRTFYRNARAALADPFCPHCIKERVRAGGYVVEGAVVGFEEFPPGSGYILPIVVHRNRTSTPLIQLAEVAEKAGITPEELEQAGDVDVEAE